MKQQIFGTIAAVSLLLVLAATSINAQFQSTDRTIVKIPFPFSVTGKFLPAGVYSVKLTPDREFIIWGMLLKMSDAGCSASEECLC